MKSIFMLIALWAEETMKPRNYLLLGLVSVSGLIACSGQSPVGPGADASVLRLSVQGVTGSYAISFLKETSTGLQAANDVEPVGTYLVLKSEVRDPAGNLAEKGTITYQYCSAGGQPAPTADCTSGSGRWKRWFSGATDPYGFRVGYGACSTPRAIGFRFTYSGKNTGIANGVSAPRDFTWAAI